MKSPVAYQMQLVGKFTKNHQGAIKHEQQQQLLQIHVAAICLANTTSIPNKKRKENG